MINRIIDAMHEIELTERKPGDQWNHEGLCCVCEKYGKCDYSKCDAYNRKRKAETLKIKEEWSSLVNKFEKSTKMHTHKEHHPTLEERVTLLEEKVRILEGGEPWYDECGNKIYPR